MILILHHLFQRSASWIFCLLGTKTTKKQQQTPIKMSNEVNFNISFIWISLKWRDFLANYFLGRTVWYLYVPHVDCKSPAGLFLESHLVNTNYKLRWNKGPCERKTINWTSHGETKKWNSFVSCRQQFILMESRITDMQSASQSVRSN